MCKLTTAKTQQFNFLDCFMMWEGMVFIFMLCAFTAETNLEYVSLNVLSLNPN